MAKEYLAFKNWSKTKEAIAAAFGIAKKLDEKPEGLELLHKHLAECRKHFTPPPPWAHMSDFQVNRASMAAMPPALEFTLAKGVLLRLVYVPSGSFRMGSGGFELGRFKDEGPHHGVEIGASFYMGIHEVTQAQWQAVMGYNPSHFEGDNIPVDSVTWAECQQFVRKLSKKLKRDFRLPTEAEWEYACRAGTITRYSHGDDMEFAHLGKYAWYGGTGGNCEGFTHPVGRKLPNPWGLYDMHGNVWEWTLSLYRDYSYRREDGREDPRAPGNRVLRGGSILQFGRTLRSANRFHSAADARFMDRGLRVLTVAARLSGRAEKK